MVRNSDGRSLIVRKSMLFTKRDLRELKARYRSAFFNVLLANFYKQIFTHKCYLQVSGSMLPFYSESYSSFVLTTNCEFVSISPLFNWLCTSCGQN